MIPPKNRQKLDNYCEIYLSITIFYLKGNIYLQISSFIATFFRNYNQFSIPDFVKLHKIAHLQDFIIDGTPKCG